MTLMSVLLCGYSSWCSGHPRKRITQGIIEICFHTLNLPLANLNAIIFLVRQYIDTQLWFCEVYCACVYVCSHVWVRIQVCVCSYGGLRFKLVSSFSTLYTEAVCWPGIFVLFCFDFFFFLAGGQLDIIWSHMGRGNINWENTPIRLVSR